MGGVGFFAIFHTYDFLSLHVPNQYAFLDFGKISPKTSISVWSYTDWNELDKK